MPELPEVETIRRGLEKEIKGLTILSVETNTPKMVQGTSLEDLKKNIKWKKIISVGRKGKIIVIKLNNNFNLIFHLKISGRLLIRNRNEKEDEYTRVIFKLSKGRELRFSDLRKFGWVRFLSDKELESSPNIKELGPDPVKSDFTFNKFSEIIKKRRGGVKKFLMDQKNIAGIGNIYANEILFKARIHPERKIENLNPKENLAIYKAIKSILKKAILLRGTSVDNYVDAFGKEGNFERELKIYGKKGKPCIKCRGSVARIVVGGRGTFFCPSCQRL